MFLECILSKECASATKGTARVENEDIRTADDKNGVSQQRKFDITVFENCREIPEEELAEIHRTNPTYLMRRDGYCSIPEFFYNILASWLHIDEYYKNEKSAEEVKQFSKKNLTKVLPSSIS